MLIKEYGKFKGSLLRKFNLEPPYNTEPRQNGEYAFLDLLRTLPEYSQYNCIVDVGANVGEWTAAAVERFGETGAFKFISVEPLPAFAQATRERFASRSDVIVLERALSDRPSAKLKMFQVGMGGRIYRDYRGSSAKEAKNKRIASTTSRGLKKAITAHMVDVSTGDEAFSDAKLNPYLIKIDCDGHDLHVMNGFGATIRKRRPILQFEYSDFWIGADSRLKDACRFLGEVGYVTFKMFPDRLVQFRYNAMFETFGYQNVVAVPREIALFARPLIEFPALDQS